MNNNNLGSKYIGPLIHVHIHTTYSPIHTTVHMDTHFFPLSVAKRKNNPRHQKKKKNLIYFYTYFPSKIVTHPQREYFRTLTQRSFWLMDPHYPPTNHPSTLRYCFPLLRRLNKWKNNSRKNNGKKWNSNAKRKNYVRMYVCQLGKGGVVVVRQREGVN